MKKHILHPALTICVLTLMLISSGCDRQKLPDLLGPPLCPSDNFVFTTPLYVNTPSVDFATGGTAIIASEFSEEVDWTVTIKGGTSNALKTYTGRSKQVLINWRGNAMEGYPFFATETCVIELKLACRDAIQTSVVIQPNTFNDIYNFGFVLQNLDGIGQSAVITNPVGANMDAPNSGIKNTPVPASPQGGNYYRMVGAAATATWYFGGVHTNINPPTALDTLAPAEVYFNAFINGNGTTNSLVSFTFTQGGSKNINVPVNWTGWKMVSFKLSDAGITSVAGISGLDYSLGAALTQGNAAEVDLDFIILTPHKPFYDL